MSVWLDKKYIGMISYKLERFKQRGDTYNFRCPLCGDSRKDKTKTRGYIYKKKDSMYFHCHNCNETMFFGKLLKRLDLNLHQQYSLEKFGEDKPKEKKVDEALPFVTSPKFTKSEINLPSIASLPFDHFAKKYIFSRKVPNDFLDDIYYSSCFKSFVDEILPGNDKNIPLLEKRIVLPFYDELGVLLGVQGRALEESKLKYMTILLHEGNRKVFGLNKVDYHETIAVVEGPFDSMFIYNAIAAMDSSLYRIAEILGQDLDYVFVYDNEKRNTQVVSNMKKTIKLGHKIFIWPRNKEEKDINDLVLDGWTPQEIDKLIHDNTYQDMAADLRLAMWSK